jgi:hypothetical protein
MISDEISAEAKIALARVARRKAMDRLKRDGALSREVIRRRLQWVAYDRKLAPAEITKAMRTATSSRFARSTG